MPRNEQTIDVWAGSLDAVPRTWDAWLDRAERDGSERLRTSGDRLASRAGRAIVRHLLAQRLGIPPERVAIERALCPRCGRAHGRPEVRSERGPVMMSFSSSAGRWLLAVSSSARVGADLERADRDIA